MNIDKEALITLGKHAYNSRAYHKDGIEAVVDAVVAEVAKHNAPDGLACFNTAVQPAPADQDILVWMVRDKYWAPAKSGFIKATDYPYWMPMPRAPISDEEVKFNKAIAGRQFPALELSVLKALWNEGIAYGRDNPKP